MILDYDTSMIISVLVSHFCSCFNIDEELSSCEMLNILPLSNLRAIVPSTIVT